MAIADRVESNMLYLNIVNGRMLQNSKEGTEGAERRDWKLKDGTSGTKWEIRYKNLKGMINSCTFREEKFGEVLSVKIINEKEEKAILSIPLDSRYFFDFSQKFKNLDLNHPIVINTYSFEAKNGKKRQGISLMQFDKKVLNYFWDAEKEVTMHGLPSPEGGWDDLTKNQKKKIMLDRQEFLKNHMIDILSNGDATTEPQKDDEEKNPTSLQDVLPPDEPEITNEQDDDLPF